MLYPPKKDFLCVLGNLASLFGLSETLLVFTLLTHLASGSGSS